MSDTGTDEATVFTATGQDWDEIAEGRETPMTFSDPKAAAAITPTTAESMPPDNAIKARLKPLL